MARDASFYHFHAAVSYQSRLTPNSSAAFTVLMAFPLEYKKEIKANQIYNQPLVLNEYKRPTRQLSVSL